MEYLELYFYWSLKFFDADPAMFLMNYINERMELNDEQRFWIAWLYGNTYQLPTAWIIANEFPDFENVDLERLTWWNDNNYKRLRYQNDQKWQKGHLPEMFESYRNEIGGNQKDFFTQLCPSDADPVYNFQTLYHYITHRFHKFGRYSAWFYIQALKETCDLQVEAPSLLLGDPNTHTQRDGLCRALGKDEWVGDDKILRDPGKLEHLNSGAEEILKRMHSKYPDVRADLFLLETILCAFKKTWRMQNGRYLGYYLDRQAADIRKVQNDGWWGIDWDLLWMGRDETLDPRVNRKTIGKLSTQLNMNHFIETGEIKFIEYLYEST